MPEAQMVWTAIMANAGLVFWLNCGGGGCDCDDGGAILEALPEVIESFIEFFLA
jgi:hypothetical protein